MSFSAHSHFLSDLMMLRGSTKDCTSTVSNVAPRPGDGQPPCKRQRSTIADGDGASKRGHSVVGTAVMTVVWSSYNVHFSQYCQGRKKVTQKVPAKVWKSVWADLIAFKKQEAADSGIEFRDDNLPVQRTVQDALRTAIDDQETGTSDEKGNLATLQDEDVLQRLKSSDVYCKLKMGEFRDELAAKMSVEGCSSSGAAKSKLVSASSSSRQSKMDIIGRTADAIERMVDVVDIGTSSVTQVLADQSDLLKENLNLSRKSLERKHQRDNEDRIDRQLNRLILLRDSGVISSNEYKKKATELVGL